MIIELDETPDRITAFLSGDVRWNDRLALSSLAPLLRASAAPRVLVDASGVTELDRGSLAGVLGTAERMVRAEGKRFTRSAA